MARIELVAPLHIMKLRLWGNWEEVVETMRGRNQSAAGPKLPLVSRVLDSALWVVWVVQAFFQHHLKHPEPMFWVPGALLYFSHW